MNPQTIIIADQQDLTRLGLRYLAEKRLDTIAPVTLLEARSAGELTRHLQRSPDATVLLDFATSHLNNAEELEALAQEYSETRWIVFADDLPESAILRLSRNPQYSLLLKDNSADEVLLALHYSLAADRYLCHRITNLLVTAVAENEEKRESLTPTETEILRLIAMGKSVKEIAAERFSSVHTIVTHKKNIFRKLSVNTVYEATKYALRTGLVDLMEYYI